MIWQSEMLDTSGRGYSTLMMSHDGHVVTTTTLGEALALELTSGKTVARHKLVGEVARLCEKEDGVVVALKGGGGMTHRARTGFTVGDFGCPPTPWRSEKPELTAPQFRAWRVVQRDGKLYALGENDRSRPEVLAYEAGRREILWRRLLTTEDARAPNLVDAFAVNDDCVYAEYELGAPAGNGDNRLLCLDPKDGEKRWEVPVRLAKPFYPAPTIKVLAGKTRLFWVRSERVDILDADSGNHLGFVGWH
jgi:outer membrane protein assembly factor BamB